MRTDRHLLVNILKHLLLNRCQPSRCRTRTHHQVKKNLTGMTTGTMMSLLSFHSNPPIQASKMSPHLGNIDQQDKKRDMVALLLEVGQSILRKYN